MALNFTLAAGPGTDIWKQPPSTDVFAAPFRTHSTGPLNAFQSASITFSTRYVQQYDQGGILFTLTNTADPSAPRKWIKAGVEYFNGSTRLSVVACDTWADWSVVAPPQGADAIASGAKPVTLQVEREVSDLGRCLWVRYADGDTNIPLRQICWVYGHNGGDAWDLSVSAAVARPGKELEGELEVKFQDFDVSWDK